MGTVSNAAWGLRGKTGPTLHQQLLILTTSTTDNHRHGGCEEWGAQGSPYTAAYRVEDGVGGVVHGDGEVWEADFNFNALQSIKWFTSRSESMTHVHSASETDHGSCARVHMCVHVSLLTCRTLVK